MNYFELRWHQRFENFQKALTRLESILKKEKAYEDQELIQMAIIKAFEFTFELSWKTMKDYLNYNGIEVSLPREVIKQAFANKIIDDGQAWIDMLEDRNLMAHTYDEKRALIAIEHIANFYLNSLKKLRIFFVDKIK